MEDVVNALRELKPRLHRRRPFYPSLPLIVAVAVLVDMKRVVFFFYYWKKEENCMETRRFVSGNRTTELVRPQSEGWLVSASLHLLDGSCSSRLAHYMGWDQPIPAQILASQLLELGNAHSQVHTAHPLCSTLRACPAAMETVRCKTEAVTNTRPLSFRGPAVSLGLCPCLEPSK